MTATRLLPGRVIEKDMFIAAAPERVFRAFVEPRELERWMVASATLDARVGGRWRFRWSSGSWVEGVIVALDPPRLLMMDWDEGEQMGFTRLTVQFVPESDGTRVLLSSSGYGSGDDWDALYDGVNSGWGEFMLALRAWVLDGTVNHAI
jgi:uncharacterized protein YndB with AHSA1/START domain